MTLQITKSLKKQVASFEKSTTKESLWQIINTVLPFIILWFLAYIKPVCFLLVGLSTDYRCLDLTIDLTVKMPKRRNV